MSFKGYWSSSFGFKTYFVMGNFATRSLIFTLKSHAWVYFGWVHIFILFYIYVWYKPLSAKFLILFLSHGIHEYNFTFLPLVFGAWVVSVSLMPSS